MTITPQQLRRKHWMDRTMPRQSKMRVAASRSGYIADSEKYLLAHSYDTSYLAIVTTLERPVGDHTE
uniref:Uncharacterized protein n=1 Tax=Aegilops tauschii subsp. strangulata TaxID=200361 RepID=A0A453T1B0_AEGTS